MKEIAELFLELADEIKELNLTIAWKERMLKTLEDENERLKIENERLKKLNKEC